MPITKNTEKPETAARPIKFNGQTVNAPVPPSPPGPRLLGGTQPPANVTAMQRPTPYIPPSQSAQPAAPMAQHPWQPFIDAAVKAHSGFQSTIQRMIAEFQSQLRTGNAQPGGSSNMQPFQGMKQPGVDVIRGAEQDAGSAAYKKLNQR